MPALPLAGRAARAGLKRSSSVQQGLRRSARSSARRTGRLSPPDPRTQLSTTAQSSGGQGWWGRQGMGMKAGIIGGGAIGGGMLLGGRGSSGRTGVPPARSSGGSMY